MRKECGKNLIVSNEGDGHVVESLNMHKIFFRPYAFPIRESFPKGNSWYLLSVTLLEVTILNVLSALTHLILPEMQSQFCPVIIPIL